MARTTPALALALTLTLPAAPDALAQDLAGWFPGHHPFPPLLADPHEIRLAGGLAWTDLFDPAKAPRERPPLSFPDPDDAARDLQAAVALGGTLPLWGAAGPGHSLVLAVQAGVFARFRIEEPSRDYAASDWVIALPVEWARGPVAARTRILHRSSHLGDELLRATRARRIEYGHEAVDLTFAYRVRPAARIYGGGAWVFRSNTENEPLLRLLGLDVRDDAAIQAGFDAEWRPGGDPGLSLLAGLDWQAAERTRWHPQLSAAAGIGASGPGGGLHVLLRYFRGTSPLGEFFLTDESYWALEAVVNGGAAAVPFRGAVSRRP